MAQHVWTVICDKVLSDSESPTTVSLVNVIERLTLQGPGERSLSDLILESQAAGDKGILINANMKLVSWWVRTDYSRAEMSHFRYALINPSGARVDEQLFPFSLIDFTGNRVIIKIAELPLSALGLHWIVIEQERPKEGGGGTTWHSVATLPLDIVEVVAST